MKRTLVIKSNLTPIKLPQLIFCLCFDVVMLTTNTDETKTSIRLCKHVFSANCLTVLALCSVTAWTWSPSTSTSFQARQLWKSQLCTHRLEPRWITSSTTPNASPQVMTKVQNQSNGTNSVWSDFMLGEFHNIFLSFLLSSSQPLLRLQEPAWGWLVLSPSSQKIPCGPWRGYLITFSPQIISAFWQNSGWTWTQREMISLKGTNGSSQRRDNIWLFFLDITDTDPPWSQ